MSLTRDLEPILRAERRPETERGKINITNAV